MNGEQMPDTYSQRDDLVSIPTSTPKTRNDVQWQIDELRHEVSELREEIKQVTSEFRSVVREIRNPYVRGA